MLPWSRGLRKEFLPLFDAGVDHEIVLKPVAHLVVETLMGAGVSDLTLVIQPRDRASVANYFSADEAVLRRNRRHPERLGDTRALYNRLRRLRIRYAEQPRPMGFGDAVLRAASSVGDRPFLLHASDAFLAEPSRGEIPRSMADLMEQERLEAVLLVRRVENPRRYGVVEVRPGGRFRTRRWFLATGLEEKPEHPRTHWAATALYAFRPEIFDAIRTAARRARRGAELELTWGIAELVRQGRKVGAMALSPPASWWSVGSPEQYLRALRFTHRLFR